MVGEARALSKGLEQIKSMSQEQALNSVKQTPSERAATSETEDADATDGAGGRGASDDCLIEMGFALQEVDMKR